MIKITSFKPMDKGALVGIASCEINAWKLQINDITIFESNGRRWIGYPSKKTERDNEKPIYFAYLRFTDRDTDNRFQAAFFIALDEWKAANPQPQAIPIPEGMSHNDTLPF